jgi:hypothetical protein
MAAVAAEGKVPKKSRLLNFREKPREMGGRAEPADWCGKTSQIHQPDLIPRLTGAEL